MFLSILMQGLSYIGLAIPIVNKIVYSETAFKNDITIDVNSSGPIRFNLTSEIPEASIFLKITNKSQYLKAIFDRATIDIWLNGDDGLRFIAKGIPFIEKVEIEKKSDSNIYLGFLLNQPQIQALQNISFKRELKAKLDITYFIQSSIYEFSKTVDLENKPAKIIRNDNPIN